MIVHMFKLQICCLFICLFIATIYFRVKRVKSDLHMIFCCSIMVTIFNIVFDIITVYTVNHLDTIPPTINRIAHIIFLGSMVLESFLFFLYSVVLIHETITKKYVIKASIPVWLAWLVIIFGPIEYVVTDKGNYSWGAAVTALFIIVFVYVVAIIVIIFRHRKEIEPKKRTAIELAFVVEFMILAYQGMVPTALVSSFAGTIIILSFFLTVESPDILLVEQLKVEKERADSANEAKSLFLSKMSHEIRTPMNAIVGMTDILLRENVSAHMREYLINIKNSGDTLLAIINDILDFSKIEAGKLDIIESTYEPMSICHDLAMIFLNRIGEKPVELLYDITPDLPMHLYGDSVRIRQVLINLVNNAIKFTEKGYVRLKIESEKVNHNHVKLICSIEDTGQGIKAEDLSFLFQSFQQVNQAENIKKEGTGLGLAITKQLIELMNGEISVKSEFGKGSTFSFYIIQKLLDDKTAIQIKSSQDKQIVVGYHIHNPYVKDQFIGLANAYGINYRQWDNEKDYNNLDFIITDDISFTEIKQYENLYYLQNPMIENLASKNIKVINKPLYSLNFCQMLNHEEQIFGNERENLFQFKAPNAHILVVDDNDMNLKVAKGLMAPYELHIDFAKNGIEALESVKSNHYDLVFMDHMMPVMDGIEATKAIRQLGEQEYIKLPIIALSANATTEAKDMFLKADMNDFVSKPIREKELEICLKKWLPNDLVIPYQKEVNHTIEAEDTDNFQIPGIDVKEGIKNSGSKKLFLELLRDFGMLIDYKMHKLEEFLQIRNLRDFTIEVHGLKNNARMIGALELSQLFYEMEQLGNENNLQEILNKLSALLEFYGSYKDLLNDYLPQKEIGNNQTISYDKLIECLQIIHDAADTFDLDTVDEAMNELETYHLPEKIQAIYEDLKVQVKDVNLESIMILTDKIKENLK